VGLLEIGLEPYQHPGRDFETKLFPGLDKFSALVIYVALRALAAAQDDDVDQAIAICRAGLAEDPTDQDLHVTLASFLEDEDRHDEAVPHFEAALAGPPTTSYYRALFQLARLRVRGRVELEEAVAALDEYAAARPYGDMMPSVVDAHVRRGEALALLGRVEEARAAYGEALRLDPDSEDAREALDELL